MWSLAVNQSVDQPIQQLCAWDAAQPADPVALCLGSKQLADPAEWAWVTHSRQIQPLCAWEADPASLGLNQAAFRSEVLGLWVEQLASAPNALPPEVSGVGAPPGFHVWAPSSLICVHATRPQVSTKAVYPMFADQGLRGEGH